MVIERRRGETFTYIVVWKTSSRENGNLLTTSDGVHCVNGRNTGLNHLFRIGSHEGIDGLT
jgi:hypothetical protein